MKVEGSDARVRVASKCVFAMAYGLLEARAKEANDDVRARELKDKVREAAVSLHTSAQSACGSPNVSRAPAGCPRPCTDVIVLFLQPYVTRWTQALEHRRQAEERLEMLQHMTEVETEKQKVCVLHLVCFTALFLSNRSFWPLVQRVAVGCPTLTGPSPRRTHNIAFAFCDDEECRHGSKSLRTWSAGPFLKPAPRLTLPRSPPATHGSVPGPLPSLARHHSLAFAGAAGCRA